MLNAAAEAVADPSTPGYLESAVQMPGFAPAVLRTLRDIAAADVTPAALEAFVARRATATRSACSRGSRAPTS